jgi:hypothetical protein
MEELEKHSSVLLREAQSLMSRNTLTHKSSSSSSSSSALRLVANVVSWLSSSVGTSNYAGFEQANSMLLQRHSAMFSTVW